MAVIINSHAYQCGEDYSPS